MTTAKELGFPTYAAVLSKRGMVHLETLSVGDEVWTHNARWKPVTRVSRHDASTLSLAGYGNSAVEAAPDQLFYAREHAPKITLSGKVGRHESRLLEPTWIPASRLAEFDNSSTYTRYYSGQAWASPIDLPRYWMRMPESLDVDTSAPPFFYMLGRWLGDGWIRQRKQKQDTVRICANFPEADDLQTRLASTGLTWHRSNQHPSVDVFDLAASSSRILVKWITRNFNQFADHKTLPAWVFGASEEQRWAMIEGYADADGHERGTGQVATVSVSRCLSVGMRLLLHSLGVAASLSKREGGAYSRVGDPTRSMVCLPAYSVSWRRETQWEKGTRSDFHVWGRMRESAQLHAVTEVVSIVVADDRSFVVDGQVVADSTRSDPSA